jgi:hypothetical protein
MPEVKRECYNVSIDKNFLSLDEDLQFLIPKLRPPFEYSDKLLSAIGATFINVWVKKKITTILPDDFLKKVGVYFLQQLDRVLSSQTLKEVNCENFIGDFTYVINYQCFRDPDQHAESDSLLSAKNNMQEALHAFFLNPNPLQRYHSFLAILIPVVHRKIRPMEDFSLQIWIKIFSAIIFKMDEKRVCLNSFFYKIDEVFPHVKNILLLKNFQQMPFADLKPEALLQLAKIVKTLDEKYEKQKRACLYSIQLHLASTPQGKQCIYQFFAKNKLQLQINKDMHQNISLTKL